MKKYIITATIYIIIIAIGIISTINENSNSKNFPNGFEDLVKEVVQNTQLIDINIDHNQALDVMDYAIKKDIEIPEIMINFDTHSDVFLNAPILKFYAANVENWINVYLAQNPNVKELYWVIPDEAAHHPFLQIAFARNEIADIKNSNPLFGNSLNTDISLFYFFSHPLDKISYSQEFLIDLKTGVMNEYSRNTVLNKKIFKPNINYKKIKVTTCTQKTLPDFKGKNVFLSIDADYTSNSGFDTTGNFKMDKSKSAIAKNFYEIFNILKLQNANPTIISLSLSPQYLPRKHHSFVFEIFKEILRISGKNDEINTYTRRYEPTYIYNEIINK